MQLKSLHSRFDRLQSKFGDKNLKAIYGAGKTTRPKVCFIFMNPTARNISAHHKWKGLRAPWLGTKNTWKLLCSVGVLSQEINDKIQLKKPQEWDEAFALKIYREIKNKNCFITNLAKCTKKDAKHLSNAVYREYLELMKAEIDILKPKIVITFGNQVSSILLGKNINVSKSRKQGFPLNIKGKTVNVYPVYYPVGQGMRNISKSLEDINYILKNHS